MRSTWIIVPAIGLGLVLAGCSSSASGPASGNSAAGSAAIGAGVPAAAPSAAGPAGGLIHAPASKSLSTGPAATAGHLSAASIIYTADLRVRVADVTAAADKTAQIAGAAGGYVSSENTTSAGADVVVKIPVAVYPQTLGQLAAQLGKRLALSQQAQDVTQQVADVNSQVTSYQDAIAQLRGLLAHAGSVGDLLSVQDQINNEEANLEQVQAEQRSLSHQVSYATVTVTIVPTPRPVVHHQHPAAGPPGLTRGASAGWHALRTTFSWTLAVLAALAPFAAIAALAAFAVYRARRWLLRRRTA